MQRFLVIGLGRFGRAVAEELTDGGSEVIALDTDMALVEAVRERVTVAAQIERLEVDDLAAAGAREVDAAIVAIGEDFAQEVLAVAILKELEIKEIVARASSDRERRILHLVGATRTLMVEVESGHRLARSLMKAEVVEQISLGHDASAAYWTADERVIGRPLGELEFGSKWPLVVIGLLPAGSERLDTRPAADHVVQEGDVLLLAGADLDLARFAR